MRKGMTNRDKVDQNIAIIFTLSSFMYVINLYSINTFNRRTYVSVIE